MSLEVVATSLAQCRLGEDHSGAADVFHKGDSDPEMPAVEAKSPIPRVLGLYLEGGMDIPCSTATLDDSSPYAVGEVNASVSVEHNISAPAHIPTQNDAYSTSLSDCPSPTLSWASSMEDYMPDTPPSAPLIPLSDGLRCFGEDNVDCFESIKLEAIDTITNLHFSEFFMSWDKDISLSAPRLLTIALPPEENI